MWKPIVGAIVTILLISIFYVEVIFILFGGLGASLAYKLISIHFKKISEHNEAKKDPIATLRKISSSNTINEEINNETPKEGFVYAFIQRKLYKEDSQKRADRDFDYYDGNAINIGYTTLDPDVRAFDLSLEYGNRIFDPSIICKVSCCHEVRQKTHELLNDKMLWREMFDVSVMDAESTIKKAVDEIDGAQMIDFESRKEGSDIFDLSRDLQSYRRSMREKLVAEGKIKQPNG